MSEKKRRLVYQSEGTDDARIVCDSVEDAINCFRADAEVVLEARFEKPSEEIRLSVIDMTDEEVAAIKEV